MAIASLGSKIGDVEPRWGSDEFQFLDLGCAAKRRPQAFKTLTKLA